MLISILLIFVFGLSAIIFHLLEKINKLKENQLYFYRYNEMLWDKNAFPYCLKHKTPLFQVIQKDFLVCEANGGCHTIKLLSYSTNPREWITFIDLQHKARPYIKSRKKPDYIFDKSKQPSLMN